MKVISRLIKTSSNSQIGSHNRKNNPQNQMKLEINLKVKNSVEKLNESFTNKVQNLPTYAR